MYYLTLVVGLALALAADDKIGVQFVYMFANIYAVICCWLFFFSRSNKNHTVVMSFLIFFLVYWNTFF